MKKWCTQNFSLSRCCKMKLLYSQTDGRTTSRTVTRMYRILPIETQERHPPLLEPLCYLSKGGQGGKYTIKCIDSNPRPQRGSGDIRADRVSKFML